jgi:hypothetical protein
VERNPGTWTVRTGITTPITTACSCDNVKVAGQCPPSGQRLGPARPRGPRHLLGPRPESAGQTCRPAPVSFIEPPPPINDVLRNVIHRTLRQTRPPWCIALAPHSITGDGRRHQSIGQVFVGGMPGRSRLRSAGDEPIRRASDLAPPQTQTEVKQMIDPQTGGDACISAAAYGRAGSHTAFWPGRV